MSPQADSSTLTFRFPDSGTIAQPTPRTPVPISSHSSRHISSSSWDSLSSESGSAPGVCSARLDPEHIDFSSTGYEYPRRSSYHHGWEFSEPVNGYVARQDVLGHLFDPLTSTSYINGPRGKLDQLFPRIKTYEVIYTDDAMMKLGQGVHRRCFNCKTHETTTWRRSMLSPGKLLCNKCGLFERTHSIPRPKSFPRRRRSRSSLVRSGTSNDGVDKYRHYHNNNNSAIVPLTAHSLNAFDSQSEKMLSSDPFVTAHNTPDVSSTPACYPNIQQSTAMYSASSYLPSAAPAEVAFTTPSW